MTEEEAKTKWCPMVRLMWRQNGGASNCWVQESPQGTLGIVRAPADAACIGSACMMWRAVPERHTGIHNEYVDPNKEEGTRGWIWRSDGADSGWYREAGHCGLAGK